MRFTRRRLIERAAVAGAAVAAARLVGDAEIAFAGGDGELVFEAPVPRRSAGSGASAARSAAAWRSGPVRAPRRFELLGVELDGRADPHLEVRARTPGGDWSPWLAAPAADGHGPDGGARRRLTDPVWTGPADFYELRARRPLHRARVVFVDPGRGPARSAAARRFVQTDLAAGPGQPQILARSSWATAACRPRDPASYGTIDLAIVHHTVSSNFYSAAQSGRLVRSICLFHKYGNRWDDIGYNFVVDRHGQVFEARAGGVDEPVVGAQAGGYNVYSSGIALLGTHGVAGPSRRAFDALARLVAWKLSLHGVPATGRTTVQVTSAGAPYSRYRAGARVTLNRIAGHGDGNTTSCPGAAMRRQLPRLRRVANRLAGTPSTLTAAVTSTSPGLALVSGQLTRAGVPIGGVTVEVQRRAAGRSITVTQTTTQADGTWSAPTPLARNAALRAVFRGIEGASAVVSEAVFATIPPAVSLTASVGQVPAGQVVVFSGTVDPVKERLTMTISRRQPDGTVTPYRSVRFGAADDGSFTRTIGFPEPGSYQVAVTSDADELNGLGSSATVAVQVG